MIEYDEALRLLAEAAPQPRHETVALAGAHGRILAEDVLSRESLPPFDNSAMDGFAVRCSGHVLPTGTELDVAGARAAGDAPAVAGEGAWEIMTGAPVPAGLDGIVPVEQVEALGADASGCPRRIRLTADVRPMQHIRRAGEDVTAGAKLLDAGRRLAAADCTLLAAVGVANVRVAECVPVALLNTGRELIDDPDAPVSGGNIRNSNGPFLALRLHAAGATVVHRETLGDDVGPFLAALERALAGGARLIVSTGAVSMGRFDFIPDALRRLGAQILFHKVRIRPGKPILAARLPGGALFFGLPGNPASTAVGLRFFVEPVLRSMLGMSPEAPRALPLLSRYRKQVPLRMHLKARVVADDAGCLGVEILGGQESFRIRPLVDANAWVVVPAELDDIPAGGRVEVRSRGHLESLEFA